MSGVEIACWNVVNTTGTVDKSKRNEVGKQSERTGMGIGELEERRKGWSRMGKGGVTQTATRKRMRGNINL